MPELTIANRIASRLADLGLTQTAVAAQVGVPKQQVSAWCRGEYEPGASNLVALADALGCTTDWLLGRTEG